MNNRGRWIGNRRGSFRRPPRGGFSGPRGSFGRGFGPPRGRGGHRAAQWQPSDKPGKRLTEKEIGITEYISTSEGFNGIIKSRYSDFQVSEVNIEGEIARLTERSAPDPPRKEENLPEDEELCLLKKYNTSVLPVSVWDALTALAAGSADTEKVEVDATDMSKEERTRVYDTVKSAFDGRIIGATVSHGARRSIEYTRPQRGGRRDTREKWIWPAEYVHFLVYKENLDTMDAAAAIADALHMTHVKPSFFGYSGTKDRRAKTTQWFSLRKVDPRRILDACRRLRNVAVGNFRFHDFHLRLGYLRGNRFRIALRNVVAEDATIATAVESLSDRGFLNYYGLQRFGSRADIPTHHIGRCLIQGRFQEAVDLILEPQGQFAQSLQIYKDTHDAKTATRSLPPHAPTVETRLLSGLAKGPAADLVGALEKIPRNTRLLYIHAYQSWVWNRCVSERIKRFGLKPHAGDLVALTTIVDGIDEVSEDDIAEVEAMEVENSHANGTKRGVKYPKIEKHDVTVKELTEDDVAQYTITDIVLPLPGCTVVYPSNMKDYYEKIIVSEDNLSLDLTQKVKAYSLSGAYRKIVAKPENLTWKVMRYTDPFGDLIQSDLDALQQKKPIADVPEGRYKALIIEVTLPSSTYATMALREILKRDTSSEKQAENNDYHKQTDKKDSDSEVASDGKAEAKTKVEEVQMKPEKRKIEDDEIPEEDAKKCKTL